MRAKASFYCVAFAAVALPLFGQGASTRKNPTSKIYVAEVIGVAELNTGEKIEELSNKSVFDAEGKIIQTDLDSSNAIVMSNGAGVNLMADTRIDIRQFKQEPFQPNRTDLDSEPSVSQTQAQLVRGSAGICTGKLIAGSRMVYGTPHATVNILSQTPQKLAMQVKDNETVITVFEGGVTVRGENMSGGESVNPGFQASIRSRGPNLPPTITVTPIPQDQFEPIGDMVNSACQARRKVYFETVDRLNNVDGATSELVPVIVNPVNPTEVGPIVSPARL